MTACPPEVVQKEIPMQTVTLEEAQSHLAEIIEKLSPGDEIVLTRDDKPVATIKATPPPPREAPRFGTMKGTILYIAPDFDDVPEGFEDYLP
jgi:antitoxin (DNA-binding transcriptional repressor) of toxin-antitoxin stability system